ncbi:VIT domain-containing protein [Halovulum sp. GXIMD14794]
MRRTMISTAVARTDEDLSRSPLDRVRMNLTVDGMFAEAAVEQVYLNSGQSDIEAVYSFPMPSEATLLSVEAEIAGTRRIGEVVPAAQADAQYEDSIAGGDSAVLLEQIEPGLFTASIGNLRAGETAILRYRYGMLLRWNGDRVRLALPTTIAPRYGRARHLQPHQLPEHSLAVENRLEMEARIRGPLAGARLASPTHDIRQTRDGECVHLALESATVMDRDVVIEAQLGLTDPHCALVGRDGDRWVALASFRPALPAVPASGATSVPRTVQIVVDCSGSMMGDSIAQARIGLERIIEALPESVRFNIIRFGSDWRALHPQPVQVTARTRREAHAFARSFDADMGGTEMEKALDVAIRVEIGVGSRDILLITDGEIWEAGDIARRASAAGYRIFSVGVGSAVAETKVRQLAEVTGGACELVTPNEDMGERIYRHFQRILAPRAHDVRIAWPAQPAQEWPMKIERLYDGDTLHAFAWFDTCPKGSVTLEYFAGTGIPHRAEVAIPPAMDNPSESSQSPLARIAAAARIAAPTDDASELAMAYQLPSRWTKYLVLHERAANDKANGLPVTVKVPQTLAAGWHGIGSVSGFRQMRSAPPASSIAFSEAPPAFSLQRRIPLELDQDKWELRHFIAGLSAWKGPTLPTLRQLRDWGLSDALVEALDAKIARGEAEEAVVLSFLVVLVDLRRQDLPSRLRYTVRWWQVRRPGLVDRSLVPNEASRAIA